MGFYYRVGFYSVGGFIYIYTIVLSMDVCIHYTSFEVCLSNVEKFEDNVNKIVAVLLLLAKEKNIDFLVTL